MATDPPGALSGLIHRRSWRRRRGPAKAGLKLSTFFSGLTSAPRDRFGVSAMGTMMIPSRLLFLSQSLSSRMLRMVKVMGGSR